MAGGFLRLCCGSRGDSRHTSSQIYIKTCPESSESLKSYLAIFLASRVQNHGPVLVSALNLRLSAGKGKPGQGERWVKCWMGQAWASLRAFDASHC